MPTVPARVTEFTRSHLNTLEDLQVLVACMEDPERWWNPAGIARQLGIRVPAARRSLDQLARRNLFDIRVSDDVSYRFSPGAPELKAAALAWLAGYRKNPLAIVKLVTDNRSVRDFADAFRIKRHDDR